MEVEVMKLYKWKKGDGKQAVLIVFTMLLFLVLGMYLAAEGLPSPSALIITFFLISGLISIIGGIFGWIFKF